MKRRKPPYVIIGAVLLCIAPYIICNGLYAWNELMVNSAMRVYPNAQQVSDGYGYYGADAGLKVRYYWTADSLQDVQAYYQKFAAPFVVDQYSGRLLTVLSVDGSELVAHEVVGGKRKLDPQRPVCHYTQPYKCLNISLFAVNQANSQDLPNLIGAPVASSAMNATPYLAAPLKTGTLIVYSYYIWDF